MTLILNKEDGLEDEVTHMQLVSVEPDLQVGKPDALKVTHTHTVDVKPDWILWGKPGDPNTDASMHLAGMEHEVLMGTREDKPDNWLLQEMEEEGAARKTTSIKGDNDSHIELQESGVSHLPMLKEKELLTFPSSPSPTIPKAAWMQRSPIVNTGMPAIPPTKGSVDLEPPLHDPLPLPDKAAEPPDMDPPKQIRAPTDVRGQTESPWGEVL